MVSNMLVVICLLDGPSCNRSRQIENSFLLAGPSQDVFLLPHIPWEGGQVGCILLVPKFMIILKQENSLSTVKASEPSNGSTNTRRERRLFVRIENDVGSFFSIERERERY